MTDMPDYIGTGTNVQERAALAGEVRSSPWRPAGDKPTADTVMTVTLAVTMTPDQVESYAYEYGLDHPDALNDAQDHLQENAAEALGQCYFLREFTTFTVSEPVI